MYLRHDHEPFFLCRCGSDRPLYSVHSSYMRCTHILSNTTRSFGIVLSRTAVKDILIRVYTNSITPRAIVVCSLYTFCDHFAFVGVLCIYSGQPVGRNADNVMILLYCHIANIRLLRGLNTNAKRAYCT